MTVWRPRFDIHWSKGNLSLKQVRARLEASRGGDGGWSTGQAFVLADTLIKQGLTETQWLAMSAAERAMRIAYQRARMTMEAWEQVEQERLLKRKR